jgi:aerobic carbon-monoxide dehydrogenase small subunit
VKKELNLNVNGKSVSELIAPRTHLADLLREKLRLTGTHLRCEQGVCGACTVLIDGEPARSCITYAAFCDGADVTTIEGLESDPIMTRLRSAFSLEHGLQCGFCTPGMLVTARDIIIRYPEADEVRVRLELSGNLCRCTGYAGIVRAVLRALKECQGVERPAKHIRKLPFGPVGSRLGKESGSSASMMAPRVAEQQPVANVSSTAVFGLNGKTPNIQMKQSFTVNRTRDEVWRFLENIEEVAACLPGARLAGPPVDNLVHGQFSAKLGPITASFAGDARIERNDGDYSGLILGGGQDRSAGSRAAGEVDYRLASEEDGTRTRVDLEIRALIAGPLAQFGRSGIIDDLTRRVIDAFARNLELKLHGEAGHGELQTSLEAGSLIRDVLVGRLKRFLNSLKNRFGSNK